MTYFTKDLQHAAVPWDQALASLMPHARALEHAGIKYLIIPNDRDEARLARNLGVDFPSPILTRYDWAGGKPWDIQRTTSALLAESARCYCLSGMGCGKTRSVLWAVDYLLKTTTAKTVLVVAPLSTLTPVWESEIFRVLPRRKTRVLYGSKERRLKLLSEPADIYVVNHHGLDVLKPELLAKRFDIVVIDELATFRNKSTELWKAANAVINAPSTRWAWGLTGSPTPNAPTDAWAQIKLFTPTRVVRTMMAFRDLTMRQVSAFKWIARPDANETVQTAMQPSVRFRLEDIQELPETSYVDREVKLDADAARAYKMLEAKMRLLTDSGKSITAMNAGILQSKLLQVAAGFVYANDKTVYSLPATGRLRALDETIAETDRKVLVFVPFLHALSGVAAHLRGKGHEVAVVNGSTPRGARDKIFLAFQDPASSLRIIVAHPQVMAHGLTLTAANVIVWYSPTTSLEIYAQANARIVRPSQTSKTVIAHLFGTAVERLTYARLRSKGKMQDVLLDLFSTQQLEF